MNFNFMINPEISIITQDSFETNIFLRETVIPRETFEHGRHHFDEGNQAFRQGNY